MEAVGVAPAAREHLRRVRARRHADEDALLGAPRRLDAVQRQVRLELLVHDVRDEQERALAELRELAAADAVVRFRRGIDDDDLIGAIDELPRDGLAPGPAQDAVARTAALPRCTRD